MNIDEIKKALIGKELSVGGEWYSEGTVSDVKLVNFEGEDCLFLYESEHPGELWCWFPLDRFDELMEEDGSIYGGQPDGASIQIKNW